MSVERTPRGKLKIFFGPVAGVGKTYNMLEAAQIRQQEGLDVVVGYVQPHAHPETLALLNGLEVLPQREVEDHGIAVRELDLDAALARHPSLILIDELAHANAPGSRHTKRWQDVEELLAEGISVYTTLNVQHVESVSDIVSQITEIPVRERVPDSILEKADEVELIDLAPDDLLQRLKEGKVYLPEQAEQDSQHFFRRGNLMALRELALRLTADRVDQQMQVYRHDHAVDHAWPAAERILVSVSPSPLSARLVRAAKRMASGLHAGWIAVYVETPASSRMSEADRSRVLETLRLAEELGGEVVTLRGHRVSEEILNYARQRNASKIIVGKPLHSRWRDIFLGSVLDELVRSGDDIDVYVISGDREQEFVSPRLLRRTSPWRFYMLAILTMVVCTLLCVALRSLFAPTNLIMIYLVGVVFVAAQYGRGPSILASILSVAAFDFFFVPPFITFVVADTQYILTFIVMLLVALTISSLTVRIKQQAESARERERRTASLYAMSREFASSRGIDNLARVAAHHISHVFDADVAILLPDENGQLQIRALYDERVEIDQAEQDVARWVYSNERTAGLNTDTLPSTKGQYVPLRTSHGGAGVLGIYPRDTRRFISPDQSHLLETFANQTALAIERTRLAEETAQARIQIETERQRNYLLSSISHDLRTPLASITGAVSSLLENDEALDPHNRRELAQLAYEEARRLNRQISNLLDMTRLESGIVQIDKEWQSLEEVVGVTLHHLADHLDDHSVEVRLPGDLPLVLCDSLLLGQVFVNLLENAAKYTPAGTAIEISAAVNSSGITIEVSDRGPGLPPGEEQHIFDKFYRARPNTAHGVGLGLTICRSIIEAHGGYIQAANRAGGGTVFQFTLPCDGTPPEVISENGDTP